MLQHLAKFKFILTFTTVQNQEEALQESHILSKWFTEIKKWDKYETCGTRRVWIEILGVPPIGWDEENFIQIAELWGRKVCLDEKSHSFEVMRVLVDTDIFNTIEAELLLFLGDTGFQIQVKEIRSFPLDTSMVENNQAKPPMEAVESNIGTTEDVELQDDVGVNRDIAVCDWGNNIELPQKTKDQMGQKLREGQELIMMTLSLMTVASPIREPRPKQLALMVTLKSFLRKLNQPILNIPMNNAKE